MTNALDTLFMSEETPNDDTASADKKEQKNPPTLRWFNVSPEIKVIGFDTKINDFAYRITYVIQPYDTPAAVSPYGKSAKYYGPHKRYEYWYTGKNSEILSYEQQLDNAFFNITFNPNGDPAASGGDAKVAQLGGKPTTQDRTGKITPGAEAQNTYMTSLFDPGSYASARIQILGDPDYLMRETAAGVNEVYKQFYQSDNFTINPNGGQVFIEIAFNEGIDYDNNTGTLLVNDSIFFWDYPDSVKSGPNAIKGVSYQVRECESVFKGGKFTQTLQLNINEMPDAIEAAEAAAADRAKTTTNQIGQGDVRTGNTQGGASPTPGTNSNNSSASTGLAQDDATGVDAAVARNAAADAKLANTSSSVNQLVPTNNAINTMIASGELEPGGSTQAGSAGSANNIDAGGREAPNTNNTTPTDTRTGEASTATINYNAPGGV